MYLIQVIKGIDVEYKIVSNDASLNELCKMLYSGYNEVEKVMMNGNVVKMVMFKGHATAPDITIIVNECKYKRIVGKVYDDAVKGL